MYSVVWGPDNDQLLLCSGRDVIIKTLQVDRKQVKWKAHDGVVMKADWNPINDLIITGGEDCKYKVWDNYGRQLYSSAPFEFVVTSIAWCPSGELFSVGSFGTVSLCDKTGWAYHAEKADAGSIMCQAWTADGTQLAGGGGNGTTTFGQLVDKLVEWQSFSARLVDSREVVVEDVLSEMRDSLDFRDRVTDMSMGFGYLVVATSTQCYVYNLQNLNTPHIFDLTCAVGLILQSDRHFVTVDNQSGIVAYSYEGRTLCNPRFAGLRVEFLSRKTLSVSTDAIAVLDRSTNKQVVVFNIETGRPISQQPIAHNLDIVEIQLSQARAAQPDRNMTHRVLAFVDKNRDLYLTHLLDPRPRKLHTMVDSVAWADKSDMLVAVADAQVVSWYYPHTLFVDRDLLPRVVVAKDGSEFGKSPQIVSFFGWRLCVRRLDGSNLLTSVSPYPTELFKFVSTRRWEEAVKLCRFVKDDALWASLAAMAIQQQSLDTAETAFAAIKEVEKLKYILFIKDIPSEEGRRAEIALYQRRTAEAEKILLQASPPLVYRAIKMNIRQFKWGRALDLAVEHKTHVDTVLGYRQKYLES